MKIDEQRLVRWAVVGYILYRVLAPAQGDTGRAKGITRPDDGLRSGQTIGTPTPFSTR